MQSDAKIYEECFKELSKEGQAELTQLKQTIVDNFRINPHRTLSTLGPIGAEEIIVALIRKGYLPLGKSPEMTELQRRMSQWGLP